MAKKDITSEVLKEYIVFPPLWKRILIAFKTIVRFGFKPVGEKRYNIKKELKNITE